MKRRSIRTKLFLGTFSLVVFFVVFSWGLNTGFLNEVYLNRKKNQLVENYRQIDRIYEGDSQLINLGLEKLARTSGMSIIIFNDEREEIYNSFFDWEKQDKVAEKLREKDQKEKPPKSPKINPHIKRIQQKLVSLPEEGYEIGIIKEARLDVAFLNLAVKLKNQDYLWLETPLVEITESAKIASQFSLFTGLLMLVIGSMIAFAYAKNFTQPVLELNEIARQIAELDFSRKYHGKHDSQFRDEVDELGNNINVLSKELGQLISDLQESNEKLAREIDQKQKIDELRKEFISNVSHELKTPLALIQGYAEGLKENVFSNEADRAVYCNVIMDEATRMNNLVKQLLDLSQIESGLFELDLEAIDLGELVDQALEKYQLRFKEAAVKLEVEKTGPLMVIADYFRIEQVLYNYLDNALAHMDEQKRLRIVVARRGDKVRGAVFNSGKAISEENIENIWLSFYKADKARTRLYGGSGLGLSIVKATMKLHHNECGVRNLSGGVEFWFELDGVVSEIKG